MLSQWVTSVLLQHFVTPFLQLLASWLSTIAGGSLAFAQQPWVGQAEAVSSAVAGVLLTLIVLHRGVTDYVLWNEGTPDQDGGQIWKGLLRVAIYGSSGSTLAYLTFKFGILFGAALMASPLDAVANRLVVVATSLSGMPGAQGVTDILVLLIMLIVVLVAVLVVAMMMLVRAVDLVVYMIAAPIVALGQMNRDGGIWASWWKNLVVLSMALPVQWLALKGMVATTTTSMMTTPEGAFVGFLAMLAWLFVALRGPHMIQQWSYHSGVGGGISYAGSQTMRLITRAR